ncbi:MAG: HEAT repeat domain-containing protein [Myxococcales bacterium]|nr:HEAT repeat domain-containing protein [Myxococcales bacterium]
MRRSTILLLCLSVATACDKKTSSSGSAATKGSGSSGGAAAAKAAGTGSGSAGNLGDKLAKAIGSAIKGGAKGSGGGKPQITPEQYEKLILGLVGCKITRHGRLGRKCAGYKALSEARSAGATVKDFVGHSHKLGIKLLKHEDEAVRWYAAGLLKSFFGVHADAQKAVLAAAPEEKSPYVLARMIYAVGKAASKNADIAAWLMKMADHEHAQVRKQALAYLASASGVAGRYEKFVEKMTKDPDVEVRRHACRYAGRLGDERLVKTYKKLTRTVSEKTEALYADCMRGLLTMWNPFMGTHKLSEEAYKLTLARIARRPRSEFNPPWIMMSAFGRRPRSNPSWYNEKAVRTLLVDVALDRRARWLARSGAARALGKLRARKQLEQLKKRLSAKKDFDSRNVLKVVNKQLSRMS